MLYYQNICRYLLAFSAGVAVSAVVFVALPVSAQSTLGGLLLHSEYSLPLEIQISEPSQPNSRRTFKMMLNFASDATLTNAEGSADAVSIATAERSVDGVEVLLRLDPSRATKSKISARPATAPTPIVRQTNPTINRSANLRAGPGTSFAAVGQGRANQSVTIIGQNGAGDWLQIENGHWIARFLVNNVPSGLQVKDVPLAVPQAIAPQPVALPTAVPQAAAPQTASNCDPSYPDFCIPPSPPDLDCGDIGRKRFTVLQPDPHRFDGDRDGIGCES